MPDERPPARPGRWLEEITASWVGTALLATTSAAAIASSALRVAALAIHALLFVGGCACFLWAYAFAIRRSRNEQIDVVGLYFLAGGSAPTRVGRHLLGSLATQVVIAVAAAAIRPFTSVAAAILVPVLGLGLTGLWAARHGTFPPRATTAGGRRQGAG